MEEPELTLVSSSDISITEMDFANLSIEEKNEAKSFQVNAIIINTLDTATHSQELNKKGYWFVFSTSPFFFSRVLSAN